jgi:8-oxo-dGTP diphosphatase
MSVQERFKSVCSVYLILLKGEEILLLLRQNTGFADGQYGLVSGHLEGDETIREGMIREAREEAGIKLHRDDLNVACTMHRKSHNRENIDFFITTRQFRGEICNMEPEKCADLKFFSLDALPENIVEYIKLGIECALSGISYAEYGW